MHGMLLRNKRYCTVTCLVVVAALYLVSAYFSMFHFFRDFRASCTALHDSFTVWLQALPSAYSETWKLCGVELAASDVSAARVVDAVPKTPREEGGDVMGLTTMWRDHQCGWREPLFLMRSNKPIDSRVYFLLLLLSLNRTLFYLAPRWWQCEIR